MRILHITDTFAPIMGGIETQVQQLARYQSHSNDVAVVTTTAAHPGDHGRSVEHDGAVTVFRLAARIPGNLPIHPLSPLHVPHAIRSFRPDVVHLHMGGIAPTAQLSLFALGGLPAVMTIHSMWNAATVLAYRALTNATFFRAWSPILTSVAPYPAAKVQQASGIPVRVVGCGIHTHEWKVQPHDHDDVHVVSAMRLTERKRTMEFLDILRSAHERAPHVRATIAGVGPLLDQARELTTEWEWLNLPGRLSADQLRELYARSDIFALPSILESFSVAVLEAQIAGLAVVVRAETGAADRVTHGVNGHVVASDDAMADSITALAWAPGELTRAKNHARRNPPPFDWSDIDARMREAYNDAIKRAK